MRPDIDGARPLGRFSRLPGGARRSGPRCHTAHVRRCPQPCWPGWPPAWPTCCHRAHPVRAAPHRCRWRSAWTPLPRSSWTGCPTGAPAERSGSPRPRSATAWTCCSVSLAPLASASPTAPSSPPSTTCATGFPRWPQPARRPWWTGWPPGCNDPAAGPTRRSCTTPSATPHRPGPGRLDHPRRPAVGRWWLAGQLPRARAHQAGRTWRGARQSRGRQPAGSRVPRHGQDPRALARAGRGPPHHRPPQPKQRAYNRLQAGLRALVEQSIAHLANAWALRRWRGLLYRVRDVFRAAGVLICLCRWLHRVPT
jgi:hypothetical protein